MRKILAACSLGLALVLSGGPAFAAKLKPPHKSRRENAGKAALGSRDVNYKISFQIKADGLESAGNFVAHDGSQANYVVGKTTPAESGGAGGPAESEKGVELKKYGTIVNCLPASDPSSDRVSVQCQFELSGPLPAASPPRSQAAVNFQFQGEFVVERGRSIVLVDEPNRRIELAIEELPGAK